VGSDPEVDRCICLSGYRRSAIAIGLSRYGSGYRAIGYRAIAIGDRAIAIGDRAIAIGRSGYRAIAIE
jgi:hypothetical protein